MDKEKIRKTLVGISVAGLITGIAALPVGCAQKASGSCGAGSCGSKDKSEQSSPSSSCGKGSCSK